MKSHIRQLLLVHLEMGSHLLLMAGFAERKSPTIIFFLCASLIGRSIIIRRDPNFLSGSFSFGAYASERIPSEGSDSSFANRIG